MVYFATNRNRIPLEEEEKPEEPDYFGDARGTLQYGVCHVEFKNIPGLSSLREALPIYVPLESRKLVQVIPLAEAAFWRQLGGGPASGERLVGYIHLVGFFAAVGYIEQFGRDRAEADGDTR